jgi:hypothetical protein
MKQTEYARAEPTSHPLVSQYTRAQAINDGWLINVTTMAKEAGFKWPVALTFAAWKECVEWQERFQYFKVDQEEPARLWLVLYMAFHAILVAENPGNILHFTVRRLPKPGMAWPIESIKLKVMLGPGDTGEAVVTIGLVDED